VAAMRHAELRGIAVGSFRYITQVTRDERAISRAQTARQLSTEGTEVVESGREPGPATPADG